MFAGCETCRYDSGDKESYEELAEKVKADGGDLAKFKCPNGHEDLHID